MLIKKFNKIGGTEYRVKSQTQGYLYLINWLTSKEFKEKYTNLNSKDFYEKINNEFKEKLFSEEIYSYNKKIKRFKMVTNNIINDMKILSKKNNHYELNNEFDLKNPKKSFLIFLQKYFNNKRFLPFKKMLKFMNKYPNKNNAEKIYYSFSCYDGKEKFEDLYNQNLLEKLAKKSINSNEKILNFRKKPIILDSIKIILNFKKTNKKISYKILLKNGYNYKKDKYLRKIFLPPKKIFNIKLFIENINKMSYKDLNKEIWKIKIWKTLDDYKDLFYRWMFDLGFSDTSSKKNKIFNNKIIIFKDNLYLIKEKKKKIEYPFKKNEVIKILNKIQNNNFDFKNNFDNLISIGNSVLAEYFVNLYYCYEFDIKPKDYFKFVNTKTTNNLYPIFTAPGGVADMSYNNNGNIINIETTIHKTKLAIEKNEIFPCIEHLIKNSNNQKTATLIFISFFKKEEIKKRFEWNFQHELKFELKPKLFIYSFEQMAKINNIIKKYFK